MRANCVLMLVIVAAPAKAIAQVREGDTVVVSGEIDTTMALSRRAGEAEWIHWRSPASGMTLGGGSVSVESAWWSFGTAGLIHRRHGVAFVGRTNAGFGTRSTGHFGYFRFAGGAAMPVASRLFAEGEGQHVRLGDVAATTAKIGALWVARPNATGRVAYHRTFSTSFHSHAVSLRGDITMGRFGALGGATTTITRTRTRLAGELSRVLELTTQSQRELFCGASVTHGRAQVIGALQLIPQDAGSLFRVTTTLRIQLRPPRGSSNSEVSK